MKKVLSLILAVVLVLGVSAVAFASTTPTLSKNDLKLATIGDSNTFGPNSIDDGAAKPDNKYKFVILGDKNQPLTKDELRHLKVGVQSRAIAGSSVVNKPEIKYSTLYSQDDTKYAFVEISMVKTFVSTKDQDFEVDIYLTSDKSRINDKEAKASLSGTLSNYLQEVIEGDEHVYMADYPVVEAKDYIRNIEVELGSGVSIFTKMFEGKKYYGKVDQDIKAEDEAVLAKYPAIDNVFYLQTIGLNASGDVVKFDLDSNYYVYTQDADGNLVYIGRSNDRLPYYNKYLLAAKELAVDVVVDEDGEPEGVGPETGTPGMGGDDNLANVNDNPSTGR